MGLRRLWNLVLRLPAGSAVALTQTEGWTLTDHLVATQVELTGEVIRSIHASVPTQKGQRRRLPPSIELPRPGRQVKAKPVMRPGEAARAISALTGGR